MRILGVSGSLQAKSGNQRLLEVARANAPADVKVELFSGLAELPHFNPDLESQGGLLPTVETWRHAIARSDALLIASPEYGHSLPGSLKNAIDWVIGTGELERKIVAITCAVPAKERGRLGLRALATTLGAVSAQVLGGEPIVKGPTFDQEVRALVSALAAACAAKSAEPP
jgi:chromate reductase, NAD(P)H dehydrogenase (quinone)